MRQLVGAAEAHALAYKTERDELLRRLSAYESEYDAARSKLGAASARLGEAQQLA